MFVAIPGKRIGKYFLKDFFVWENEQTYAGSYKAKLRSTDFVRT